MFVVLIIVKYINYSYVLNYGYVLVLYVLLVVLYVGILIFNFVYLICWVVLFGCKVSVWWVSKLVVGMISVIVMVLVEGGIMMLLGF